MATTSKNPSILYLINNTSGKGQGERLYAFLKHHAAEQDGAVHRVVFNDRGWFEQVTQGIQYLVVGGGDGTVSHLLPMCVGKSFSVGVLPLGTGNDLARETGVFDKLPLHAPHELGAFYARCTTRQLRLFAVAAEDASVSEVYFSNYLSLGYDAKVVGDFARWRTTSFMRRLSGVWMNRMGYAVGCLKHIRLVLRDPPFLSWDDQQYQVPIARSIVFANVQSIMGLGRSNEISNYSDDTLEAIVVESLLDYAGMVFRAQLPHLAPPVLGSAPVWKVANMAPDIQVQIDGEPHPELTGKNFSIRPAGTVSLLVPD